MKILIVEDDINIQNILQELLIKNNYEVTSAYSGSEALLLLEKNVFDLVLLDLMLPAISGEEIIKISSDDKVKCLLFGASDYITKPFNSEELLARIQVQLRQKSKWSNIETLRYKELKLLNDNHTLLINNKKTNLTKTEYAILKHLLLNQNQVISKNKLLDLISVDTEDCDENSLRVHISNLRRKIREYTEREYIESIWGIGFKIK